MSLKSSPAVRLSHRPGPVTKLAECGGHPVRGGGVVAGEGNRSNNSNSGSRGQTDQQQEYVANRENDRLVR